VLLLATELVSNAADSAPTPIEVRVSCSHQGALRVEVADSSSALPVMGTPHPEAEHGRGLRLIDGIAQEWGATPLAARGKIAWFELQV
jgi:serine/threonine-protein kinase RsbW